MKFPAPYLHVCLLRLCLGLPVVKQSKRFVVSPSTDSPTMVPSHTASTMVPFSMVPNPPDEDVLAPRMLLRTSPLYDFWRTRMKSSS